MTLSQTYSMQVNLFDNETKNNGLGIMLLSFSHSVMSDSLRPHGLQHASLPCPSVFWSLLKLMSIESVMPSNHLIHCRPLLLLPSIFPSIRVFSNELALRIRWPKYWASALAPVLPMNIQGWFPLGLTGLIPLGFMGGPLFFILRERKISLKKNLLLLFHPPDHSVLGPWRGLVLSQDKGEGQRWRQAVQVKF